MRRSAEKICWEDLLRKSAEKICWENLLRRSAEKICWRKSAEKICWEDLLKNLLRRSAEKICWEDLLRRSAEKICWRKSAEKICWEDLLKKSAEKICWEWLWIKTSLKFLSFFTQGGFGRSRRETTLSSFRAHRTSKTEVKCEFWSSPSQPSRRFVLIGRPKLRWNANFVRRRRNPLVVSCSSDVQNWGEMRILYVAVATLSSFRAHRTSKTEVKCESAWVVWQPYRRFVLIGRPKLRWNANFELRSATLSSLRAGQMSKTVVKWWFLYAACCPGLPALDSYIFAYAAVVKRGFWNVEWHAVVARRTFCFCWMNPLVGFGGSMARNCGETHIFYGNCRKHRTKRLFCELLLWNFEEASHKTIFLAACSVKFRGSIARNARFASLCCEISKKPRTKRSFWKLVLWNFEEASHETIVLEAFSVKIVGSIARNARFASLCCEISKKPRTKRSFWKLVLWNFEEASHETIVLEACAVKFRGSFARNDRFGSFFCENGRKHRAKRSFCELVLWKLSEARAKRSFWKLVLWNLEEASHETIVADCEIWFWWLLFPIKVLIKKWLKNTLFQLLAESWFWRLLFPYFPIKVQQCFLFAFSLCFLSVCFLSVFSLCFLCVFSLCFLSVFSVCRFSFCIFSLCVFSVCIFCLCVFSLWVFLLCVFSLCVLSVFLSVFSVCLFSLCFLSVCFLSVCFLSVCFLCVFFPVFSLCVFCLCFFSVFSLCVSCLCVFCLFFSVYVFSLCVFCLCFLSAFSVCVLSLCAFCLCVLCVCSLCVFCLCVSCLCVFSVFSFCVFSLCVLSLCVLSVFSLCVFFCLCFLSGCFLSVCFLFVFTLCFLSVCFLSLCFLSVRNLVVQRGREVLRGSVVGKCCGEVL